MFVSTSLTIFKFSLIMCSITIIIYQDESVTEPPTQASEPNSARDDVSEGRTDVRLFVLKKLKIFLIFCSTVLF